MSDLRTAAEIALEALNAMTEEFRALDLPYFNQAYEEGRVAITKLNAALAQSDPAEVRQGWEYMREKGLLQETWNEHPIDTDTTCGPMLMTVGDTLARAGFIKKPKPLTDQEIYKLFGWYAIPFVRAVEKAHGIGGEE